MRENAFYVVVCTVLVSTSFPAMEVVITASAVLDSKAKM